MVEPVLAGNHYMLVSSPPTAGQSTVCNWFIWILFKWFPLLTFLQILSFVNSC